MLEVQKHGHSRICCFDDTHRQSLREGKNPRKKLRKTCYFHNSFESLNPERREVRAIQVVPASVQSVERNDISGEAHICLTHWHGFSGFAACVNTHAKFLHHVTNHGFQMIDILFGEERAESPTANAVKSVVDGRESGPRKTELRDIKGIFIPRLVRIQFFIVVWFIDMKFVRTDSNNWASRKRRQLTCSR